MGQTNLAMVEYRTAHHGQADKLPIHLIEPKFLRHGSVGAYARNVNFESAMGLMRQHDPQLQEDGFEFLRTRTKDHVGELMSAFATERDQGLRCWLLELIGLARSETALPLFAGLLADQDESFREWARVGLELLDSKEARTLLWIHDK